MNILIVDPSKSYRELVKEILSNENVNVIEAKSGQEAFTYLKHKTPSAISIAHELGDMDSFKFLKTINLNTILCNVPKFLLTSNASKEFKREAYDAGFTEIFVKSDFPTLKRALKSLMLYATMNISAKVLYVEDTQSTADYTSHIMYSAGWEVDHVKSGEAAAELLDKRKGHYDLVVTDLVLEGNVSGIGLINLIRQGHETIRDIPILAVSGWNDLLRQVYVLKHGAGDFIAKPFHETDFLARAINLILNKKHLDEVNNAKKSLYLKANIDAATGLNNRHYMDEFGDKMVADSCGRNEGITLALVDIDYFKRVNDSLGHATGDAVLKQVSSLVKSHCHSSDLVVRYGGDELLILMTDVDQVSATERLEMIRVEIARLNPVNVPITVTIGAASCDKKNKPKLMQLLKSQNGDADDANVDLDTLFKTADNSLYMAKQSGRDQVCVNSLMELESPERD